MVWILYTKTEEWKKTKAKNKWGIALFNSWSKMKFMIVTMPVILASGPESNCFQNDRIFTFLALITSPLLSFEFLLLCSTLSFGLCSDPCLSFDILIWDTTGLHKHLQFFCDKVPLSLVSRCFIGIFPFFLQRVFISQILHPCSFRTLSSTIPTCIPSLFSLSPFAVSCSASASMVMHQI